MLVSIIQKVDDEYIAHVIVGMPGRVDNVPMNTRHEPLRPVLPRWPHRPRRADRPAHHPATTRGRAFGPRAVAAYVVALAAIALVAACASPSAARAPSPPDDAPPRASASSTTAPVAPVASLAIPDAAPDGPPIQARVLLDTPGLKVMAIRLRGVELPPHRSDFPVVITAVEGEGTVVVGDAHTPIDARRSVALAPGVEHAVVPSADGDLVLLVTHARGGAR